MFMCQYYLLLQIFYGNIDNSTIVRSTLEPVYNVTAVRIIPHEWHNEICMSAEVYGCFTPTGESVV